MKVFLPLKEMFSEVKAEQLGDARLHTTVFEDNQSTYFLATNQRITSRTRYLLAKWHWFWDAYNQKQFTIIKCPTDQMNADYMTKLLAKVAFENNRERVQGW